jgi:uncharacterized membrane protein YphA (DoxX/SURF4 family)
VPGADSVNDATGWLEIGLGVLLILAAFEKFRGLGQWRRALARYRIGPLDSTLATLGIPSIEVVVGIGLALGLEPAAAAIAAILFAGFAVTLAVATLQGAEGDCGCYGDLLASSIGSAAIFRAGLLSAVTALLVGLRLDGPVAASVGRIVPTVLVAGAILLLSRFGGPVTRILPVRKSGGY